MIEEIIAALPEEYIKGSFPQKTTFYFSVDETKKTVTLDENGCTVHDGKLGDDSDCMCKTTTDLFNRIWNEGYRPGVMDFMSGKIKSNAPMLLQQFLSAFGR